MISKYPVMGWNSWDCYGAAVNEMQVRANAKYMHDHLKEYGWEYIVVDIQWYQPSASSHDYEPFADLCMDAYGRLIPAENRFPSSKDGKGFKELANYVHSLGLKFGIHIMRGMPRMAAHNNLPIYNSKYTARQVANPNNISEWNPDMYGLFCDKEGARDYYDSIFSLYASWGVDFVKVDDIAREYPHYKKEIEVISDSLRSCGRDMVLSLSPGPAPLERAEHLKTYANMWRITDDFWDNWKLLYEMFERAEKWCTHASPGHYPDADMLPIGALRQCEDEKNWTRLTHDEQMTMMSLWCMMRSPLIIGAEMTKNDEFTLSLLTNAELLFIDKYTHGAHQVYRSENEIVWMTYSSNSIYVALFNISNKSRNIKLDKELLEINEYSSIYDIWKKKNVKYKESYKVNKHGVVLLQFKK